MNKALNGIRVLDFSRILAGPFCAMNLADLGAEVIKIEKPESGDDSRAFGPFVEDQSGYYILLNRGKKSITLDLKSPTAKEIIYEMVKQSDVLVENFKPGVMDKLGFSYDALKEINPGLIYCSISGFGQDSPYRNRAAYDLVAQGMSGMMSITGFPENPPTRLGSSLGDVSAGLYATLGILAALFSRTQTGKGQYVDIAMMDSVFAFMETNVVRYTIGNVLPTRVGSRHPLSAPFDTYQCKDGLVIIAIANDPLFLRLCEMMGMPDLIKDPRFDIDPHRVVHEKELKAIIEGFLADYTVDQAMEMMLKISLPCAPIQNVQQACEDPSILTREMLVDVEQPGIGKVRITGSPIKLSETPTDPKHAAPLLGEHSKEILKTLGYTEEQISGFEKENIF